MNTDQSGKTSDIPVMTYIFAEPEYSSKVVKMQEKYYEIFKSFESLCFLFYIFKFSWGRL